MIKKCFEEIGNDPIKDIPDVKNAMEVAANKESNSNEEIEEGVRRMEKIYRRHENL